MIQRIQSIFLFASLCVIASMLCFPVAHLDYQEGEILAFNYLGFYSTETGAYVIYEYSLMVFAILICVLNFVTIFLYGIRRIQLRLCIYSILLILGLSGVTFFVLYSLSGEPLIEYKMPIVFPFVAAILQYLAFRGIRKDEIMVQALSRLR